MEIKQSQIDILIDVISELNDNLKELENVIAQNKTQPTLKLDFENLNNAINSSLIDFGIKFTDIVRSFINDLKKENKDLIIDSIKKSNEVILNGIKDLLKNNEELRKKEFNDLTDLIKSLKNEFRDIQIALNKMNIVVDTSEISEKINELRKTFKEIENTLSKKSIENNELEKSLDKFVKELKNIEFKIPTPSIPSVIGIKNFNDIKINPAKEEYQDILSRYKISDIDDGGVLKYYGFVKENGEWYILREDTSSKTYRYVKGNSNYTQNWGNRSSLNYDYFFNVFN